MWPAVEAEVLTCNVFLRFHALIHWHPLAQVWDCLQTSPVVDAAGVANSAAAVLVAAALAALTADGMMQIAR